MSTILKETEANAGLSEGANARSASGSADSGAKPQPVALEVSVTVNGARTVEGSEKREPFSESTKTVLVFGNGAVIRLQASVAPGQLLFLTNEKTKKEVVCQVVKSKNYRNISGYVELEFTEAVVGFWGMRFPGDRVVAQNGTPNVVQATPATGSPVAPQIAAVPSASAATQAVAPVIPVPAQIPTTIPTAAKPAPSAAASTPVAPSSPAANAPAANVPAVPAASNVPLVVKTDFTVSSSAPKTVLPLNGTLSLPRAAESKPVVPAPISAAPKFPAPVASVIPIAPAAPSAPSITSVEPAKTSMDSSADALRAENARLQEQLAALLNPQKTTPAPINAKPLAHASAKVIDIAQAEAAKPEVVKVEKTVITDPAKPDSWLPDLAAMLAKDTAAAKEAVTPKDSTTKEALLPPPAAPVAPVTPIAAKPIAQENISTASLQSLLAQEQVKIPSWLEPLARNSGSTTVTDESVSVGPSGSTATQSYTASEIHDELDDVFEHRNDDLSEALPKTQADESADGQLTREQAENLPVPTFGSQLSIGENGSSEGAGKGKLLAIAALILLLVGGGGYWYTQQSGTSDGNKKSVAATKPQPQTSASANDAPDANQNVARASSAAAGSVSQSGVIKNPAATPSPVNANLVVERTRAAQPGNSSPVSSATNPVQQSTVVQEPAAPKRASLGDVHLLAPNVTRRNDGGAISDADVSLGGAEGAENAPAVNGFVNASGPAAPAIPVQLGGAVTAAKLLKSVPPVYPAFAKTQRVSGDVKIDALIDATGQVTTMKVVSGPSVLYQAAMEALRQWKYQPANLDGKAVPIHLTVTIQFRMQ